MYFIAQGCAAAGKPAKTLSDAALTVLCALPWRGNARELRAVLESLVGSVSEAEIGLSALLTEIQLDPATGRSQLAGEQMEPLRVARERFERDYVAAVLSQCRGRIPDAAKILGIQRTNLYRKIRLLQLPRGDSRRR